MRDYIGHTDARGGHSVVLARLLVIPLLATSCGRSAGGGAGVFGSVSSASGSSTAPAVEQEGAAIGVPPGWQGLTPDQRLDQALTLPGARGMLRGVTGSPQVRVTSRTVTLTGAPGSRPLVTTKSEVMTDFPLVVSAFYGHAPSSFPLGATVTLRLPGGNMVTQSVQATAGPDVRAGEDIFVYVGDSGTYLGGNTAARVVAGLAGNGFAVRGDVVYGPGPLWQGFHEPINIFIQHFAR